MDAGSIRFLATQCYESDEDTPLAAATATYYPGIMYGPIVGSHPFQVLQSALIYTLDSANPATSINKKIPHHLKMLSIPMLVIDATPFYPCLGKCAKTAGPPVLHTVSGSLTGDVPNTIHHLENNTTPASGIVKDYQDCKVANWQASFVDGGTIDEKLSGTYFLHLVQNWLLRQEILAATNQLTTTPNYRGETARNIGPLPYRIQGVTGTATYSALTWNANTWSKYLTPPFLEFGGENKIGVIPLNDGNDYAGLLLHGGKHVYDKVKLYLLQTDGTTALSSQVANIGTAADLTLILYRRTANDKLTIVFKNAKLESWDDHPFPETDDPTALPIIQAVFTDVTDIQITEQIYDASDANDPNADGDYEL